MAQLYDHIRKAPVTKSDKTEKGQVDAAFARAARIVEADYEWPFQSHASMGPGCAVADVRPDGVTVWTGTQKPHFAAQGVAAVSAFLSIKCTPSGSPAQAPMAE